MWQNSSEGDGRANKGVELLITTDGELKMSRCDTLNLEILCGILQKVLVDVIRQERQGCDSLLQARGLQR